MASACGPICGAQERGLTLPSGKPFLAGFRRRRIHASADTDLGLHLAFGRHHAVEQISRRLVPLRVLQIQRPVELRIEDFVLPSRDALADFGSDGMSKTVALVR